MTQICDTCGWPRDKNDGFRCTCPHCQNFKASSVCTPNDEDVKPGSRYWEIVQKKKFRDPKYDNLPETLYPSPIKGIKQTRSSDTWQVSVYDDVVIWSFFVEALSVEEAKKKIEAVLTSLEKEQHEYRFRRLTTYEVESK